ncbi:peptidase M28 family [Rhizoctonia solani]|uniref:Peptidase M28 family n=1 Tax=Rhizoctonia solani TaxID=456999 RepID=A0A8H7I450_9AGAM|nr:peptidase M28 family [Rhizoctonia solani]
MMNKRVYKNYVDLTNIIVRVSDGTPEGKRNAVLVNSHLDSTLPSPGAADDAISRIKYTLAPVFNNAEESLQDGSHLYATQHFTAHTVRAIINLEAAGSTGPELLFQATSEEMIEHTRMYLDLSGRYLKMAIVGNSYLYHTRRDTVENIEPGVAQHMAENTRTLDLFIIVSITLTDVAKLQPSKDSLFLPPLSILLFIPFLNSPATVHCDFPLISPPFPFVSPTRSISSGSTGFANIWPGFGECLCCINVIYGSGHEMVRQRTILPCTLYPFSIAGCLGLQVFLNSRASGQDLERLSYRSVHLFFSAGAWAVQSLGIGSAGLLWFVSLFTGAGIAVDWVWGDAEVPVASYVLGSFGPLVLGTEVATSLTDIFVPLTGRMGSVTSSRRQYYASLTTVAAFYAFPLVLPLSHRFGARALKIFTSQSQDGLTHQKRFFGMHVENITSGEYTLQLGAADAAPGFEALVNKLAAEFGAPGAKPTLNVMDDWNPDWDVLYPFSQFVTSYKVAAPRPQGYESSWEKIFTVKAYDDILDFATGTRKLTLKISHPGLIWTGIDRVRRVGGELVPGFSTTVWGSRHHIKEASYYGTNEWSIKLEIKVPGLGAGQFTHEPLKINFVGIEEKAMWPGKKNDRAGPAMEVFERMDQWFEEKRGGVDDVMLLGASFFSRFGNATTSSTVSPATMDERIEPTNKPKRKPSSRRVLSDQTCTAINNTSNPPVLHHAPTGPPVAGPSRLNPPALLLRNMSTSSVSINPTSAPSAPALRRRQSVSTHTPASKSVDNFNNHIIYSKSPPPAAYTRPLSPRQLGKLPANGSMPQLVPNHTGNVNPLPRPPNFIRPTAATPAPRPTHPPPPTPKPQPAPTAPRSSSDSSIQAKNWNPYRPTSPDSKRHRPTKMGDPGPSSSKVEPPTKTAPAPAPTPATSTASSTHQPRPSTEDVTMNLARMILTPPHTQRMVTYPGTSSTRLAARALQTIRVGGGQVGSGGVGLSILGTMTKLEFVKDVMGIAPHWKSSEHLEVEDILGLPLFTRSLTCIGTEQRLTNRRNFKEILSPIYTQPSPSSIFAIFDSHTRPTHPTGSAFIVSASIDQTARYLEKLFAVDPDVLNDGGALLGAFDAHFVVPSDTPPNVSNPGAALSIRPTDPDVYAANLGMLSAQMELRAARQRAQREVEMVMEQLRRSENAYVRERRLRESRDARVRELETRLHDIERARRQRREERRERDKSKRGSARASMAASPVEKEEDLLQTMVKGEAPVEADESNEPEIKVEPLQVFTAEVQGSLFDEPEAVEDKEAQVGLEKHATTPRLSTGGAIGFLASIASRSIPFWGTSHQPDPASIPTPATPNAPPLPNPDLAAPEITFHCDICQDTEPEVDVAIVEGCGHRFGRECLKGFVSSKLADGKFPIVCPTCATGEAGGTIGVVSSWLAESVGISQSEYERWTQFELAAYSFAIECTQCNRSYMVSREDYNDPASKSFTCAMPDCVSINVSHKVHELTAAQDHTWCKSCSTTIDKDKPHTCDGSAELTRLMEREGWKKCPGCQAPIEKSEGCNHMTCTTPACNTHFCYVCGGKVIQSVIRNEINEAIMQHFSNCKLFDVPDEDASVVLACFKSRPRLVSRLSLSSVIPRHSLLFRSLKDCTMRRNQHKRLGKRQNQFVPTWTGQVVEPTSALLPPVATTPDANAQPTTSQVLSVPNLPTSNVQVPPVLPTTTTSASPLTSSTQVQVTQTTPATTQTQTQPQVPVPTVSTTTESTASSTSLSTSSSAVSTTSTLLSTLTTSTSSTSEQVLVPTSTTAAAPTTRAAATTTTPRALPSTSLVSTTSSFTNSNGVVRYPKENSNAGTIVGAIAGGFVGLICLVAFVSWIIRQHQKRRQGNHDDFDRQSYLRNSQMIPDDVIYDHPVRGTQAAMALARNNTNVGPRPPTMIERKNTYFGHSQAPPSFAPGQVISFEPGQIVSGPASAIDPAYPSPVAFSGYTPPDQHMKPSLFAARVVLSCSTVPPPLEECTTMVPIPTRPLHYGHDGYTYPMHPGPVDHRGMIQSVTPFQAQQYAEITRQLEGGHEDDSFHPMSPVGGSASPIGQAMGGLDIDSPTTGSPSPLDEKHLPNPFDEPPPSLHQRIDSTPPALPPIESLSRTGTPIDPNPQHAHWSYDAKSAHEGHRLSVAGMLMPEPPTPPPAAILRDDHSAQVAPSAPAPALAPVAAAAPANRAAAAPANRPVSVFDADDAYGGM